MKAVCNVLSLALHNAEARAIELGSPSSGETLFATTFSSVPSLYAEAWRRVVRIFGLQST